MKQYGAPNGWTDHRVATVKRMHAAGCNPQEISRALGGTTPDAVAEKVREIDRAKAAAVKDLKDLPWLFDKEGVTDMGATRKTTPERLDKIIQFIWDYQDKHNGETPRMTTIGNHIGVMGAGSMTYWINMLVDSGRLNKISSLPFRASINMDNRDNQKAIERFKRIRKQIDAHDAEERERIRAKQEYERKQAEQEEARQAVFAAAEAETAAATPAVVATQDVEPRPRTTEPLTRTAIASFTGRTEQPPANDDSIFRFERARSELRDAQKAVKQAMPAMIKVAETRDLVHELLERGYVVSKR